MTKPPKCLDCTYGGQAFPCRLNGEFNHATVARAYVKHICSDVDLTPSENHWSFDCMYEITHEDADLAWVTIIQAVGIVSTRQQASMLAAGGLEDLIAVHGPTIIDRLELEARRSPRFRYLLTGVWSMGNDETPEWKRVESARMGSPTIDETDQFPEF